MEKELNTKQVADRLGVSRDAVERWIKLGKLKAYKKGVFPGRTSPFMISESEIKKLEKRMNEQAKT
jgi:excisionase family DNA binding protein